jgi:aspartyl-tRNA(Asn)/glutamyl-tRNA(Gln) amidotransferase subunit C
MKLTQVEVEHIATLARLHLTETEKEKYAGQLSGILDYMDKLGTVDTSDIEPTSQVTGLTNITREDSAENSGIADELVACAPEHRDGFVTIPKIFENK